MLRYVLEHGFGWYGIGTSRPQSVVVVVVVVAAAGGIVIIMIVVVVLDIG